MPIVYSVFIVFSMIAPVYFEIFSTQNLAKENTHFWSYGAHDRVFVYTVWACLFLALVLSVAIPYIISERICYTFHTKVPMAEAYNYWQVD